MSHRTQITLTDEQYERLLDESGRTGLGLAELVRRALVRCYGDTTPNERIRVLHESAGAWTDREVDGEQYVENLRRGMARRTAEWQ
ncbi:MAG: antitoxin [Dehalococcoidia bacterium]|nr:MAG: antitoxin [Dehalococcoidia bacterium]